MKKLYILMVAILIGTTMSFGQGPIITMISDGDCTGGDPSVMEIYANGTVDFSLYSLQKSTDGDGTWATTYDLTPLGTITDSFVYVYYDASSGGSFDTEFGNATPAFDLASSVLDYNGDDPMRIINTTTTAVIDQYGVDGTDGTGTSWEYKDGFAKRNSDSSANAGAFNPANWTISNGALDGLGTCQGGNTFESIIGLGTFQVGTSTDPTLAIISPADATTVPTGDFDVTFAVTNFDVGAADDTHDGHIHYTVDGGNTVMKFDTTPISLTGLAPGSHTVYMELVDNDHNPLSTAVNATVNFTVQAYTQVANIAALRAGTLEESYELTGEALITYAQSFKHIKYIQDATGAIMIYDESGNITTGVRDNGISEIKGRLTEYNGMMEFIPATYATVTPTSTVSITPELIQLTDIGEAYESKLVLLENVTLADATDGDGNFTTGTTYVMTSGTDTANFYTDFYSADYISTALPAEARDIVGLISEKGTDGFVFTARDTADFSFVAAVAENTIKGFNMYPNPTKNVLNITTAQNLTKNVQIFDILGKQVVNTNLNGTTLNVANLNAGLYLIKVQEAGNSVTRKLVIK